MNEIRVAVVGVGNCASSLVQGTTYYSASRCCEDGAGLARAIVGGFAPSDIKFVAAFDVDSRKVGKDLSEAVFAEPNNTYRFADVPKQGVTVRKGPTLDGVGERTGEDMDFACDDGTEVLNVLRDSGAEVIVNYLPVGSQSATEWWAGAALEAGCAFINCIPVFIASCGAWAKRFEEAKLPVIGDDIKSQFGATILHRLVVKMMSDRGIRIDDTYQLNFGGNMDFKNMLENARLGSKKKSKTDSVLSQSSLKNGRMAIHVSPSDYVPFLMDKKVAYIRVEGANFGGAPLNLEMRLQVWDSPNSAGVVVDAVRCAKVALMRGLYGPIDEVACALMKSPGRQYSDSEAFERFEEFIRP
jgi:myo-inositol-1-phosphate synthase